MKAISSNIFAQFVLDKIAMEARQLETVSNRWLVYNAFNEWEQKDRQHSH